MKQRTDATRVASPSSSEGVAKLRERVEQKLGDKLRARLAKIESADIEWLVHELGVHQIELEAQNEALQQAQIEIEDVRDRYATLYHKAPLGYVTTSLEGKIVDSNDMAAHMLGIAVSEQLRGRRLADH